MWALQFLLLICLTLAPDVTAEVQSDLAKPNILRLVGDDIGSDWAGAATGRLNGWKLFFDDGGIRVPLIEIPPKNEAFTKPGRKTNEYAYARELPMTIRDYAGVKAPLAGFNGRKLFRPSGVSPSISCRKDIWLTDRVAVRCLRAVQKFVCRGR